MLHLTTVDTSTYLLLQEISGIEIIKNNSQILSELREEIAKIENWNHDAIKEAINDFAASKNLKFKDFGPALRVSLTFSSASAGGVFDVIEILGREECLKRIKGVLLNR